MRPRSRRWLWALLALATVLGGVLLLMTLAVDSLGTTLDREDFDSEGDARRFVSEHAPTPLPASAVIRQLTYERWTDWHLEATVALASPSDAATYLAAATKGRATNDEYCGATEATGGVGYFLKAWMACGTVRLGQQPTELLIRCNTR